MTFISTRENFPNGITRMTVSTDQPVQPSKEGCPPRLLYTRESDVAKNEHRDSRDFIEVPGSNDTEDDIAANNGHTEAEDLVEVPGNDHTEADPSFNSEPCVRWKCNIGHSPKAFHNWKEVRNENHSGSLNSPIELSSGSESDSDDDPDEPEGFYEPCHDVAIALDEPNPLRKDLTLDEHYRLSTHEALEDLLATGSPSPAKASTLWRNILNQYSLDQVYSAFKQALPGPQRATARAALKLWVVLHNALAQFRDDTQYYGRDGEEWRQHKRMLMAMPGKEQWRNALEARRKHCDPALVVRIWGGWLEGAQFARALADYSRALIRHGVGERLEERILAYNKNLSPWFGFIESGDADID
ncbi:hypothetical protein PMIN04_008387 [Paraphaeosphaeria minitans]